MVHLVLVSKLLRICLRLVWVCLCTIVNVFRDHLGLRSKISRETLRSRKAEQHDNRQNVVQ